MKQFRWVWILGIAAVLRFEVAFGARSVSKMFRATVVAT